MLHIILTILKIIGILLLVLLALFLFVTAAVLFVPVRYRIKGEKKEDNLFIRADVFWFMHLLRVKAIYPEPGRVTAKLLWFTLFDSGGKEKTGRKEKKQKKKENIKDRRSEEKKLQRGSNEGEERAESREKGAEKKQTVEEKGIREQKIQEQRIQEQKTQEWKKQEWKLQEQWEHRRWMDDNSGADLEKNIGEITEEDFEEEIGEEAEEKIKHPIKVFIEKVTNFFEKLADILRKIKNAVKNIWYTIKRLCDRIVEIRNNISYYIEVFGEEETKKAFLTCRQELNRIWKNIRPKKCRAELMIGTGEPETTGYILAIHGILYPIIGNDIIIEPDFENQVVEGKLFLKGRITVFVLLHTVIKIYFDKNIRYFLKRFKREEV